MLFNQLFRRRKARREKSARYERDPPIGRGFRYLYMIIGGQIALVFGILATIMAIGKVISTPGWIFLLVFLLFLGSLLVIYRRAKRQFRMLKESLASAVKANRNLEISTFGGMLTVRMEARPDVPEIGKNPAFPELPHVQQRQGSGSESHPDLPA